MNQTRLVLNNNGYFLVKLPDFDLFLEAYRKSDKNFFSKNGGFGISSVTWSWKNYNVPVNIENIISMMFCGYWNKEYGDHFSGKVNNNSQAYHGPVKIELSKLKQLLLSASIREIIQELRNHALKDSNFKQYNHQNAWSRDDIVNLLGEYGFDCVSMNKKDIINSFNHVKGISAMADWSMYILAEPKH